MRTFVWTLPLFFSTLTRAQTITVGPNLGTWPIGEIQDALTASGGNGTYSWTITSGSLPTGLALRTDVPSFFPAGASAGLIGIATTPGTYSFTISVTSGGSPVSQACTMKITALTLKDGGIPDAFVGSTYSYTMTPLNNAGLVTFTPTGGVPPGMSLSSSGVLSGTPTTPGNYNISFTINDGTDTVGRGIGLTVSAVGIANSGLLPDATRGNTYNVTLIGSGGASPYTFSIGSLPQGLSLNSSTGLISGTVSGNQGRFEFNATVTDNNTLSYTKHMAIDVLVPTVTAGFLQPYGNLDACTIGLFCSRGFNVWNGGTDPFTYSVTGLPPGMDLRWGSGVTSSYISAGDLELWGTPTATGTYNVNITVTDANSLVTNETFPLVVSALGVDGRDFLPNGARGTSYSKTLRVLGGTGPYSVMLLPVSQMPSGLALAGITVSGTPVENGFFNAEFSFSDSASHSLQLTEYFNVSPVSSNVNLNNSQYLKTVVNSPVSFQLSACCGSAYTWSTIAGALPTGITLSAGGLFAGTPTTSGVYTFTLQATDQSNASNFAVRVITVEVTPLSYSSCCTIPFGNVGTSYSYTLPLTGASGTVNFALEPGSYLPQGLTLNASSGLISGTPGSTGQFQFGIVATDASNHSQATTFNVYIFPGTQGPPVTFTIPSNLGTFTIGQLEYALTASGGTTTSYTWALVSGTLPPGLALRTDVPTYFPAGTTAGLIGVATTPGTYSFTLSVTSGTATINESFTMKITGLTVKDLFTLPNSFVGVPYTYTLTALGAAGPVTWTATSALPAGLSLSSTGVVSGTPTQAGTTNVNFNFTDGVDTVYRSLSIAVNAIHFTTSGLLPNVTQGSTYNTTITAAGGTGSFTYTASGLPGGFTMNSSGVISSASFSLGPNVYGFTVTATDTGSNTFTQNFSINVIGVPPSLPALDPFNANIVYKDATIGVSYGRQVGVFNGGTAPFTWAATGLPPGMSIRPWDQTEPRNMPPGYAEIWGTPTALGTFSVQLTVTDANGATAGLSFPLTVTPLMVEGSDFLPNGTVGVAYSRTLRVLGGSGPYSYSLYNPLFQPLPFGLTLNNGVVSGTPAENGSFTAVIQYQDSAGNVLQLPEGFTISGGSSSTISVNQAFNLGTVTTGSNYSFQLGACCASSGTFTWSQVGGTLPPGITISAGGLLSGTANTAGTYTFILKAADSTNAANFGTRQFQLVVTPLNYTSSFALSYGNVGIPYSQNLLSAVTGANGAVALTLQVGSYLPPGLTFSSGSVTGTPTAAGRFGFNIIFADGGGNTLTRGFTLFIYPSGGSPALQFRAVAPCRVIDTRNANGPLGGPFIAAGTTRAIPVPSSACNIPANAAAYSLNMTVVPRTGTLGYLSVWPNGQSQPLVSTLNSLDGSVLANAAIVPAGISGSINAFATNDTDLIVDINGYFVPLGTTTGTLQFYPLPPCRVLDTRNANGSFGGPSIPGNASRSFTIPSSSCSVPGNAAAYSLNTTVVPQGQLGYLTAWPTGQPQPVVSTLNSLDGTILANAAIVPAGTNGAVSFFATNTTDLVVDINGYFAPPATGGLNFYTVAPCRLADTRNPTSSLGGPVISAGSTRSFPLLSGSCQLPTLAGTAQAYSLNMTVVPQEPILGYLSMWPAGGPQPLVSTLNALKGQVVANAAIVPAGTGGSISAYATNDTHLIIDTNGYFAQ